MKISGVSQNFEIGRNVFLSKKDMSSEMFKLVPKKINWLKKINDKNGEETFNILINAIGTAAVAPFFIAYNPLSKTDENTKKYSALRQPVSAVLAVVTQCGLVIPWNWFVDSLTNNGKLGQYFSLEAFQSDKYLRRQIIKQKRGKTLSDIVKYYWGNLNKATREKNKKEIDALVKAKQADQYGRIYAEFLDKGTITVGKTQLPEEELRAVIKETCGNIIKKNEKMLNRYEGGEKYNNKVRRAEFLFENADTVSSRLQEVRTNISKCTSQEAVDRFMSNLIRTSNTDGTMPEMIKIFEEDLKPKGTKNAIIEQIDHILGKTQTYRQQTSFNEVKKLIEKSINGQKEELTPQLNHFKKILKMLEDGKPMSSILEEIKKTHINVSGKSLELDNIRAGVVDKYISIISSRNKGLKAVTGLAVSLAIMPFTCHALNYLYPRFMDTFFPHLSKSKKEGGKK